MSACRRRVVFAGIDGATWSVIEPMVAAGKLPHLAAMMRSGTTGPLTSTIPPNSSLAWTSFQTGVHPGKHGVFFFRERRPDAYERPVISWDSVQVPSIWRIASEAGKRVCCVTIPLTFPVEHVNGAMIGGLLTPDRHSDFIWPPELRAELEAAVGDLPADNEPERLYYTSSIQEALDRLHHVIEQITRISEHLLEHHDPDLFAVVFRQVDLASHRAWHYQDPAWQRLNPGRWEARKDLLAQVYEAVDAAFGRIRSRALALGGEVAFGTCSDHGFGPLTHRYYMNRWLVDEGYLVLKRGVNLQRLMLWSQRKWHGVLRHSGVLRRRTASGKALPSTENAVRGMVDWSRTRAYGSFSGGEDVVLVNLKGREPQGIVEPGSEYEALREEILRKLPGMRATDGARVIESAWKREDLWQGAQVFLAPDIQCLTVNTACNMMANPVHPVVAEPALDGVSAMHRMEGVFGWEGEGMFRRGARVVGPQIADMAPTILHLLGLPAEDYMDGRVMKECFEPGWLERNPVKIRRADVRLQPRRFGAAGAEDDQRILQTMKSLGYME